MKATRLFSLITLLIISILLAGQLQAKKKHEWPQVTVDGLELLKDTKLAVVYAKPGSSLAPYKKVKLLASAVAFKKNWERDQRRNNSIIQRPLSPKQIETIKSNLAASFRKIFSEELTKAGYILTEEIADDVMIVRPAIINLDITAPDTGINSGSRTYASSAGEMTLYLELYDSVTSELFAKAIDRRADDTWSEFYTWTNSVTNKVAATRILRGWAKILVNALNESKTAK